MAGMRRGEIRLPWVVVAVLIGMTALVPAGYFGFPYLHRWQMLSKLDSKNANQRRAALIWVGQGFDRDPAVRQAAIDRLKTDSPARFFELQQVLDLSGDWRRRQVGQAAWLRWLELLAKEKSADARAQAARQAGKLTDMAGDAKVIELINRLGTDHDASVRRAALTSMIELSTADQPPAAPYQAMIHTATGDGNGEIASRAWVALALRPSSQGYPANWRAAAKGARGAVLYAAMRTNPDRPGPAIQAVGDHTLGMPARVLAAYALHFCKAPAAQAVLLGLIPDDMAKVTAANSDLAWTAALSVRLDDTVRQRLRALVASSHARPLSPGQQGLKLAALYRLGMKAGLKSATPIQRLAMLESPARGDVNYPLTAGMSPMLRLATVRRLANCKPGMLWPLFGEKDDALRDEACVLAMRRLDAASQDALIESLLRDEMATRRQSGALLAGMTGRQHDLLRDVLEAENTTSSWLTGLVMQLGLAMQTGKPGPNPAAVLVEKDVPKSTVLLSLMMQGSSAAWDDLLGPRGDSDQTLDQLLCQSRWWYVLKALLPPDAPSYWVWAPQQVRVFQLHVLRVWYLLHRDELTHLTAVGYRKRMVLDARAPTALTQGKVHDGTTR